jgi:two-component system, LytTR family, sensor kinase
VHARYASRMRLEPLLPRAWRLPYALVWLAVGTSMSVAALQDYRRGHGTRDWEPLLWEFSSVVCVAGLALAVHALTGWLRGRSRPQQWAAHAAGVLGYVVLHVAGMFGLRFAVYGLAGVGYEPGPWSTVLVYEGGKDLVAYASFVMISRGVWSMQRNAQLERELAAARLARLADQVQPHFLFNTLNLVSSVMYEDVAKADRLLCQLADLLRQTLAAQQRGEHTVGEELALIEPFLALMQSRFGEERLHVEIQADAAARACRLPALLLLAPVENAIKHDVARHRGQVALRVSAERVGQGLRIEVVSECLGPLHPEVLPATQGGGLGLSNLRERLTTSYGAEARCTFEATAQGARLQLELPLR